MDLIIDKYAVERQKNKDIGIEIEMEGKNLKSNIPKYWRTVPDGSLRGESIEYVLSSPVSITKTKFRLKYLKNELKDSIFEPNDRCGVHIHVNCQEMTVNQVINFTIVYLILEDLLIRFCGEDRVGNHFCLSSSNAETLITELRKSRESNSLNNLQSNRYRYASINLSSLRKFGSVEFRAFQTPKDIMKIQKWIDILFSIKNYSLGFIEPYNIIENISFEGAPIFLNSVLGAHSLSIYDDNQDDLILKGVRKVQEIAYAHQPKNEKINIKNLSGMIAEEDLREENLFYEDDREDE